VHHFSGIQLANGAAEQVINTVLNNLDACSRWRSTRALIIEEVSMLSGEVLEKLEKVARAVRADDQTFGGIQLILVGDFYQLPPVEGCYAFEASVWSELAFENVILDLGTRKATASGTTVLGSSRSIFSSNAITSERKPMQTSSFSPPSDFWW